MPGFCLFSEFSPNENLQELYKHGVTIRCYCSGFHLPNGWAHTATGARKSRGGGTDTWIPTPDTKSLGQSI